LRVWKLANRLCHRHSYYL